MNWTQEYLAEQIHVSKNTIHDIETGKKFIRAQKLIQMANVFNIEIYELFLPKNFKKFDSTRLVVSLTDQITESIASIRDDFINNKDS